MVINAQPVTPTAPTIGTITQPTCILATGSVLLTGLPAENWIINPGALAGTGSSSTLSGSAAGTYNYTVTNSVGCTSVASAHVVIVKNICAHDDSFSPVNGYEGTINAGNVLTNDKLNGDPVNITEITVEVLTPATPVNTDNPVPTLDPLTGIISVPEGTPASTYTIIYRICEVLNPTNWDQAVVTIAVTAPVNPSLIIAIPDEGSVNGILGGIAVPNVLVNDKLNGNPLIPSQVTVTFVNSTNPNVTLNGTSVIIAPHTPAGIYYLDYRICEMLNPSNCDQTTVTLTVKGINPDLTINKSAIDTTYSAVGDMIHYNLHVTNSGNVNSYYNLLVTDLNAVITSGIPIGILDPGKEATITAVHTITLADLDAGKVLNTALLNGSDLDGLPVMDTSNAVTVNGLQRPQLTITKFATETTFYSVGEIIHYTFEVFNCGNVTVTNIVVSDTKVVILEGSPISSLAPRHTVKATGEYVVTQGNVDTGKITNIAFAAGIDPAGKPVRDDSNAVTLFANQPAQLVISKIALETSFSAIGDTIHYLMAVKNFRSTTMSDIVVSDPNAMITSGNPIFRLASGKTAVVTAFHVITQSDLDAGKVVNVATARGKDLYDFIDKATSNEVTVFAKQSPNLILTKTAEETFYSKVGDLIHYTNEIKNTGNVTITGITLMDPNTSTTGSNRIAGLNPGKSVTVKTTHTISQADLNIGFVEKTATISGFDPNSSMIRINSNQMIVKGSQQAQMTTALTAAENSYSLPGDVIHYTIEVRNTGNVMLTNLKVADQDAVLTNGNSIANLVPGAKAAVTAEHVVTQSGLSAGKLISSATVTGNDPNGKQITSISNELTIQANKAEGLIVTEVIQEANCGKVGEAIHYTITVKNHGKVPVSNITVSDPNAVISGNQTIASLRASGFVTIAAIHVVTQSDLDVGLISNTASITGTYPDGTAFNEQSNQVAIYALKNPQLTTRFSATETSFKAVGDQIHYTIEVGNTGNLSVSDIVLYSQGDLTISGSPVLNLAPGNTARLSAIYTITVADLDAGKVVRAVNASGNDPDKQQVEVPGNEISVLGLQNPELSTIASALESSFSMVGEVIHYNIQVKNSGNVSIISTAVTDPNAVIITVRPNTILLPDESFMVLASHTITQADLNAGKVVSVATSAGFDLKGNTIEKKGNTVTVIALQRHELTVSNTASQSIFKKVGDVIVYTVMVKNTGNVTMNDIYLTDTKVLLDFSRTIASLAPGETDSVMAEHRVTVDNINAGKIVTAGIAHGYTVKSEKFSYLSNEVIVRLTIENYNLSNFPNPFAYETTIVFDLPEKGEVILKIYDVTGREVGQIEKREFNQGRNFVHWNTFDTQKGLYILQMYYNSDLAVRVISVIN
ncbi:MAG: hypothetical protein D4R64_17200 [Porphyromonadaceae bacterium]|nr:MAG: hypothetical protein D4R64_17200 [Porphyromonadaceae bacterium]